VITRACILTALLLFPWASAQSGERVMTEFKDKRAKTPEVLSHVPLKAVVSEFLDPLDSGLGKSLGYLIWREVLTAISDQAGAGVIVAEAPPGERLVDLLEQDYHQAAERIGRHQRARMVIWGAVEEEKDELLIDIYLSTLTDNGDSGLKLSLSSKVVAGPRYLGGTANVTGIEANISHKRFNFAPIISSRQALFERTLVTAAAVKIVAAPNSSAKTLLKLPAGRAIQAVDMIGAWFKIKIPAGGFGFIHAGSFGNLRLPPKEITGKRNSVNLRAGPGTDHPIVGKRNLKGRFRVLDMRYRPHQGLWYRIDLGSDESWVAGWLVEPRFSFPAVHFIAGLYRYYGERHNQGIKAFEQFIERASPIDDNVNLSPAYQWVGASKLLSGASASKGYRDFSSAIALTPYNPNAYLLRGLASLGTSRPKLALDDMEKALQLDADFKPAHRMVAEAATIANQRSYNPLGRVTRLPSRKREIKRLVKRFRIKTITVPRR